MIKSLIFKATIHKSVEQDIFNGGCQLGTFQDFGIIETLQDETLRGLMEQFENHFGDLYRLDNRLESQSLEDSEGNEIKNGNWKYEAWKQGTIDLYAVNYSFYISRIEVEDFEEAEINHYFSDLKQA